MNATANVVRAVAQLRAGVEKLQSGADWKRALDVQARFHNYSFGNCALIAAQCPHATRVAGFHAWKKLGRSVKKGEKGIMILAPAGLGRREVEKDDGSIEERTWRRFRVAYVFDISQTEGAPLAALPAPVKLDEASFASSVEELRKVALALPDGVVSGIELRSREPLDPKGAGGWYNLMTRAIVVITDGASRAQQFKTLVHEIAHAILHPRGEHHSQPVREVEAESVAYVVCSALGLDSSGYSFPYVAHWASGADAGKLVQQSGERIAKTARTVLAALATLQPNGGDDDDASAPTSIEPVDADAPTMRAPELVAAPVEPTTTQPPSVEPTAVEPRATRWQVFQSYREIAELLRPAFAGVRADAPIALDATTLARVQALLGGAAARDDARTRSAADARA